MYMSDSFLKVLVGSSRGKQASLNHTHIQTANLETSTQKAPSCAGESGLRHVFDCAEDFLKKQFHLPMAPTTYKYGNYGFWI